MLLKDLGQVDVADGVAAGHQDEVVPQEAFRVQVSHRVAQRSAILVADRRDGHLAPDQMETLR